MLNILHFIDHYNIGGPGKTIINSAKFIDNKKFTIFVASFLKNPDIPTEFSHCVTANNISFLGLPEERGFSFKTYRILYKFILLNNIRIIHTHGYKTDLIGFFLKIPIPQLILISTQHGWILNNFRQRIYKWVVLKMCRFFDGVITVSKQLFSELPVQLQNSDKSIVIHNAIVLSDYTKCNNRIVIRKHYRINEPEILIGVVGRLSIEKGIFDVIDAIKLSYNINQKIRLIMVGDGPLYSELKKKIQDAGLSEIVQVVGYHNPIQPFYEAFDILVSPSHTEGISNVILEAMSYSLPIIATNVGGNPEIINDKTTGIFVPPHSPELLAKEILILSRNHQKRILLGKNARNHLDNFFSFTDRMKKIEKFYNTILNFHG